MDSANGTWAPPEVLIAGFEALEFRLVEGLGLGVWELDLRGFTCVGVSEFRGLMQTGVRLLGILGVEEGWGVVGSRLVARLDSVPKEQLLFPRNYFRLLLSYSPLELFQLLFVFSFL